MKMQLLSAAIAILLLSGCEREQVLKSTDVKLLLGNWRLVQPVSGYGTTLNIKVDQYSGGTISGVYSLNLSGKAAVNSYFTSARLINWETGDINVETITATMIGGSAATTQFEKTYFANLNAVNRYELTDKNRLRFRYGGGVLIYEK